MKKIIFIISLAVLIGAAFLFFSKDTDNVLPVQEIEDNKNIVIEDIKRDEIEGTEEITPVPEIIKSDTEEEIETLPEKVSIDVLFTSQSPFGVWDERHEEACEEASLLMVAKYLSGGLLTPEISEKELQAMIDFQIKEYGEYKDSNMKELAQLASDFYSIDNLEVVYDFKKEDLKKELAKGNPIIVPTAGRLLGNPFFTPPGPLYHNVVLVGYDGNNIITNDPGTKRGEGYVYDIDVLYNAIHDFTGKKEDIEEGRKAMIVISL